MNLKTIYYTIVGALSFVVGLIAQLLGGWDIPLQLLIIVMAVDYLTGILCALVWKRSPKSEDGAFESKASFKGLIRKMCILLAVLVAYNLDRLAGTTLMRTSVILFFVANDGLSIIENLGIMGLPMPQTIKNAFAALKKSGDEGKTG